MKSITKNLAWFTLWLFGFTVLFRFALSYILQSELFGLVWITAIAYGVAVFCAGWFFGRRDKIHLPIYDIGFRFHLATYLVCNIVAESWYALGLNSHFEKVKSVHLTALIWGVFLLIHYSIFLITRKNAIRGIKKSEIFE